MDPHRKTLFEWAREYEPEQNKMYPFMTYKKYSDTYGNCTTCRRQMPKRKEALQQSWKYKRHDSGKITQTRESQDILLNDVNLKLVNPIDPKPHSQTQNSDDIVKPEASKVESCRDLNAKHGRSSSKLVLQTQINDTNLARLEDICQLPLPSTSINFNQLKGKWEALTSNAEKHKKCQLQKSFQLRHSKISSPFDARNNQSNGSICCKCDDPEFQLSSEESYKEFKNVLEQLMATSTGDILLNRNVLSHIQGTQDCQDSSSHGKDESTTSSIATWFGFFKSFLTLRTPSNTLPILSRPDEIQTPNEKIIERIFHGKINQYVACIAVTALQKGWYSNKNQKLGFKNKSGKHLCEDCAKNELLKHKFLK